MKLNAESEKRNEREEEEEELSKHVCALQYIEWKKGHRKKFYLRNTSKYRFYLSK